MFVVMDKDGNLWGAFMNARIASDWATNKWPDQELDKRERPHRQGWNIVAIRIAA